MFQTFGRAAYFGSRYDAKARMQCNYFERYYQCKFICELCMSQRPIAKSVEQLWYFNFKEDCPRYLTYISDSTYRKTATPVSPWTAMKGWNIRVCFHDFMHTIYLGIANDLIANLLADFLDHHCLGSEGDLDHKLRQFSLVMHAVFKKEKFPGQVKLCFPYFLAFVGIHSFLILRINSFPVPKDFCPETFLHWSQHRHKRESARAWFGLEGSPCQSHPVVCHCESL